MLSGWLRVGVLAQVLALTGWSHAEAQSISSQYTRIDPHSCTFLEDGARLEQDWVRYRCDGAGGIPIWLFYTDGVRLRLSFGPERGDDLPIFSADREPTWPVEWRGVQSGTFTPYAAIVRTRPPFQFDGDRSTQLSVFRVWRDRPACFVGNAATNDAARRLADQARGQTRC